MMLGTYLSFVILVYTWSLTSSYARDFSLISTIKENVSVTQSGTYYDALFAIDGQNNYSVDICQCCSVAVRSRSGWTWWQIDLGQPYLIDGVALYGRSDNRNPEQIEGAKIYAGLHSLSGNEPTEQPRFTVPESIGTNYRFTKLLQPAVFAQFFIVKTTEHILTICEFLLYKKEFTPLSNLFEVATTSQTGMYLTYNSTKAIDGINNYSIDSCNCCSVTNRSAGSWWQINLEKKYFIDAVEVFGRESVHDEQLQHAVIYASNSSMDGDFTHAVRVTSIDDGHHVFVNLDPAVVAQYFAVSLAQQFMTICEFHLFSVCDVGEFGNSCSLSCHCADGMICDVETGDCRTPGCLPGWKGNACNTECEDGQYGSDCVHECHCKNGAVCNKTTGHCPQGCDVMWTGDNCGESGNLLTRIRYKVTTTQSGTYDHNNASFAIDGVENHNVDTCQCCSVATGSVSSWWQIDLGNDYLIDAIAIYGRFDSKDPVQIQGARVYSGRQSLSSDPRLGKLIYTVPNSIGSQYYFVHKISSPVVARYFLITIQQHILTICEFLLQELSCFPYYYGNNCSQVCGHCKDNASCHHVTGSCQNECAPGYQPEDITCNTGILF